MTDRTSRARRDTIRADYAAEETEAAEAEAVGRGRPTALTIEQVEEIARRESA